LLVLVGLIQLDLAIQVSLSAGKEFLEINNNSQPEIMVPPLLDFNQAQLTLSPLLLSPIPEQKPPLLLLSSSKPQMTSSKELRTSTVTEPEITSFANGPMALPDTLPLSFLLNAKAKRESNQSFPVEETDILFKPLERTAMSNLFLDMSTASQDPRSCSLFKPKDKFFFVFPFLKKKKKKNSLIALLFAVPQTKLVVSLRFITCRKIKIKLKVLNLIFPRKNYLNSFLLNWKFMLIN